jgi:hypothetical protein
LPYAGLLLVLSGSPNYSLRFTLLFDVAALMSFGMLISSQFWPYENRLLLSTE